MATAQQSTGSAPVSPAVPLPAMPQTPLAPRIKGRELLGVTLLVAAADVLLFRGHGYAGLAAFAFMAPLLLVLGHGRPLRVGPAAVVGLMLAILAARFAWQGSVLLIAVGSAVLVAFSMALHGWRPYLLELAVFGIHVAVAGAVRLLEYARFMARAKPGDLRRSWLGVTLPMAALLVFGLIFIMANPDLATSISTSVEQVFVWIGTRLERFGAYVPEIAFCLAAACIAAGLLRPLLKATDFVEETTAVALKTPAQSSALFVPLRNTLVAVIALFAVYLVFEFATLWFREFPPGFYYAGYAHRGAAWLTAALALATLALSMIFRAEVLADPRVKQLKRMAWIWSLENFVLAATVYNRMHIYVDFNGMTRMRTIGLFGITSVVVGFCLVLWKINRQHSFVWLVRRQLWTVGIAAFVFSITPVDWLVHRYNVRQILAGDLAPAVQISVHPISSEGVLALAPLTECEDTIIREGVCALLAERSITAEQQAIQRSKLNWTAFQGSEWLLLDRLRNTSSDWEAYRDASRRTEAWQRFRDYAFQWY